MDKNFIAMLKLLSSAAFGTECNLDQYDIGEVLKFANRHNVSLLVQSKILESEFFKANTKNYDAKRASFLVSCVRNYDTQKNTVHFLNTCFKNRLSYAIIKGPALSALYPHPEYRQSGDTDILIDEAQEEAVLTVLKQNGFKTSYRTASSNHSKAYHEKYGMIEVHTSLFNHMMQKDWFYNRFCVSEDYIKNGEITTLGINDGFLFIFLHAVKHFICHFLSAKQLIDILVYIRTYKDSIDFEKMFSLLKDLGFLPLLEAILTIGTDFCGLSEDELCPFNKSSFSERVLKDMQTGGFFGFDNKKHGNMFEAYHIARLQTKIDSKAQKYMTKTRRADAIKTASFSLSNLRLRYQYIVDKPYLLPLAVLQHIGYIVYKAVKRPHLIRSVIHFSKPSNEYKNQKLIDQRMVMIDEMGLL